MVAHGLLFLSQASGYDSALCARRKSASSRHKNILERPPLGDLLNRDPGILEGPCEMLSAVLLSRKTMASLLFWQNHLNQIILSNDYIGAKIYLTRVGFEPTPFRTTKS
jgi:hypothetical protein